MAVITIAGHRLTDSQLRTLDELSEVMGNNHGAEISVYRIWGRSKQATAHRRNVGLLAATGVLHACGMDYDARFGRVTGIPHGYTKEAAKGEI